jgi:octaprenyl-diphosphate synthase
MGGYIAGAGGKRLRPILLLLAARAAGYRGPRGVRLACAVELLHTATLIHDDVVDQAPLRRGQPSANAQWGDDASVLVGDHLYAKSFALLVRDNDSVIMETLARATVSMTEAEVFQLQLKRSGQTSEADYVRIITQKTASFMSACCRIGALLGGVPHDQLAALTRYGLEIGIAFQMSDDSLDFVANEQRLGKAIAADLREGKRTLPLIAMLERAGAGDAEAPDAGAGRDRGAATTRGRPRRRGVRARARAGLRRIGQGGSEGLSPVRRARAPHAGRRFRRGPRPVSCGRYGVR